MPTGVFSTSEDEFDSRELLARRETHADVGDPRVYVLVNLKSKENPSAPEYFVVPSNIVKERTVYSKHPKSELYSLYRKDILDFKDKWDVFGDPRSELRIEEQSVSDEVRASGNTGTPDDATAS